ncbi:uncharacterized protein BP01DRAFT_424259 [Aspergillus saccharolyticus JOP 1030-1]|uniref:Dickkopf N-terminal cysteine-rich domain-containing protein n=1 Tax=Aspergillus saccharolyticus JOP 1030-1 TaxID=1450539 RepID=A0A318Z9V5_9EURO|nr:hypothetical protein BP01DRAFT_424259 [Aspergillus saccharolyticus JOP 1030-1]PYH44195.1 hypothetical protein BP01DRAFT_424259 [Aspergillus saccharolyticus JOP 1030-1]
MRSILPPLLLLFFVLTNACTPPPDPTPEYLTTRPACTTDENCQTTAMEPNYCFPAAHKCLPRLAPGTCCATHNECATNYCHAGSCAISQRGKPCASTVADCRATNTNENTSERWICATETRTCLPAVLPVGASCLVDEQCGFGACQAGPAPFRNLAEMNGRDKGKRSKRIYGPFLSHDMESLTQQKPREGMMNNGCTLTIALRLQRDNTR